NIIVCSQCGLPRLPPIRTGGSRHRRSVRTGSHLLSHSDAFFAGPTDLGAALRGPLSRTSRRKGRQRPAPPGRGRPVTPWSRPVVGLLPRRLVASGLPPL